MALRENGDPVKHDLSERPLIDFDYLGKFTQGDPVLQREILTLFANQVAMLVDQLSQTADNRAWTFLAHSLKGTARAVGAWQLAQMAETMEQQGADGGQRRELVKRLRPVADRAVTFARSV